MAGCSQNCLRFFRIAVAILVLICLAPGGQALAATTTGSFQVGATVVGACRVSLPQQRQRLGSHYACLPAPEISRYVPPPPRVISSTEGNADAPVLTMEF